MKISLSKDRSRNQIEHVSDTGIVINETTHQNSIIVSPDHPVMPWEVCSIETLSESNFEFVKQINPDVLILGCGTSHQMPDPKLLVYFFGQRIGFEVMTTIAACRTYNLLVDDERDVMAYLILDTNPDPN